MEELLDDAAKKFAGKGKAPKLPVNQFKAGAIWLWDLLMGIHDVNYYEDILRKDIINRLDEIEVWQESLISETAKMMVRRDRLENVIAETGDLLDKFDKQEHPYKESNPLHVHLKELDRSIGMQREHLGLSFKVNPNRMKESPKKKAVDPEKDGLGNLLHEAARNMNVIPE